MAEIRREPVDDDAGRRTCSRGLRPEHGKDGRARRRAGYDCGRDAISVSRRDPFQDQHGNRSEVPASAANSRLGAERDSLDKRGPRGGSGYGDVSYDGTRMVGRRSGNAQASDARKGFSLASEFDNAGARPPRGLAQDRRRLAQTPGKGVRRASAAFGG